MATKLFCDRCSSEIKKDEHVQVFIGIRTSIQQLNVISQVRDLCDSCFNYIKSELEEKLPIVREAEPA